MKPGLIIALTFFAVPFSALAAWYPFIQGEGIVMGTSTTSNRCPALSTSLSFGSTGAEVTALQTYLASNSEWYPEGMVTGYYGSATMRAVAVFQGATGVVSSGTAATTGWGAVGPKTRAAIARACAGTTPTQPTVPSAPVQPATTTPTTSAKKCTFNDAPVIHGASITAYKTKTVPYGESCTSQQRTCDNGTLSGTYKHAACTVAEPVFSVTKIDGTIDQYYPFFSKIGSLLVVESDQTTKASEWATRPVSSTKSEIVWGDPNNWPGPDASAEEFEFKKDCALGLDFLWLNAYRSELAGHRYPIETTKAEIRLKGGPWIDITAGGTCGTKGQPYMLSDVVKQTYEMRVWGNVYDIYGNVGRRFFWQHEIAYVPSSTNSCWLNDTTTTRAAVSQRETWWDSVEGWFANKAGSMGANGEPDGASAPYSREQHIGKGAGPGWTTSGAVDYCMQYQWDW